MQGSCLPVMMSFAASLVFMLTVSCSLPMEGVGLTTTVNTTGMPLEMPPLMPPLLLVRVRKGVPGVRESLASLPRMEAKSKPAPKARPLTAGTANMCRAMRVSMFSSKSGLPSPAGTLSAKHWMSPPTESPSPSGVENGLLHGFAARVVDDGQGLAGRGPQSLGIGSGEIEGGVIDARNAFDAREHFHAPGAQGQLGHGSGKDPAEP